MNDTFGNGGRSPRQSLLVAGLLGISVCLGLVVAVMTYQSLGAQKRMDAKLSSMMVEQRAQSVVQAFYARDRYKAHDLLCEGAAKDSGVCRMVTLKSFSYGQHNDLWVMLDGATVLADANLPKDKRRELTRAYANLLLAVNAHGALDLELAGADFPAMLATNNLYAATVAQAMVCKALTADVPCVNGLPEPVGAALRRLAAFVEVEGPKADAYNIGPRMDGVKAVLASL